MAEWPDRPVELPESVAERIWGATHVGQKVWLAVPDKTGRMRPMPFRVEDAGEDKRSLTTQGGTWLHVRRAGENDFNRGRAETEASDSDSETTDSETTWIMGADIPKRRKVKSAQ